MDGTPQRPLRRFRVSALIVGVVCLAALVRPALAQTPLIANGDFEAGTTSWSIAGDLAMSVDASFGGVDGPSALQVVAGAAGVYRVQSQYWLGGSVTPGASYRLDGWIRDNDAGVSVSMRLDFLDAAGTALEAGNPTPLLSGDAEDFRRLTLERAAPAGSLYARAVVEGSFDGPGATFALDGVVLSQTGAAPTVEPTQQPAPTATPVVATSTPTATPTPKATRTPTPTPTPKPPPLRIGPFLRVAEDGDLAAPWDVTRGELTHAAGGDLLFRAEGEASAWIEQAVTVIPGAWYEASARLAPVDGVRAAWVRLAWYASVDASGAQIETDDSDAVAGDGALAIVVAGGLVTTGPVRAPLGAYSAKVRILLQPTSPAGAAIVVEGVAFAGTAAPAPTPSPTPTPTPTRAAATPTPTPAPGGGRTSGAPTSTPPSGNGAAGSGGSPPATPSPEVPADTLAAQGSLRLTEVMPDPPQPGRDADYEWLEITNTGNSEASLGGMLIRDAQAGTPLPALVVRPGASVVIAGRLAEVDADARLDGAIGNGLGNEGDHIELVDASGRVVDAFDYGRGTDLTVTPGQSVHRWFGADGGPVGAGSGAPSPGVHAPLATGGEASSNVASGVATAALAATVAGEADPALASDARPERDDSADLPAWVLLLAVGGGALGGVAVQRLGQRREPPAVS